MTELGSMPSRELSEWLAFGRIEPYGEERADIRTALVCQTIAQAWLKRPDGSPWSIGDFLPRYGRPEQGEHEAQAMFLGATLRAGGTVTGLAHGDDRESARQPPDEQCSP